MEVLPGKKGSKSSSKKQKQKNKKKTPIKSNKQTETELQNPAVALGEIEEVTQ